MTLFSRFFGREEPQSPRIEPMEPPPGMSAAKKGGIGGAIIATIIAAAMGYTYIHEGDYADHPADRGGATRYGVTESVAREFGYRGDMRAFPKHCDAEHPVCADLIYTTKYIDRPGYRPMAGIDPAVFFEIYDSAVLHGPPRSSRWFQEAINEICAAGIAVDGKVGRQTVGAYQACQASMGRVALCTRMLDRLDAKQEAFFRAIVARRPSQKVFLRGWLNQRVGNVDRRKCSDWRA